jgi:hypothetical protein
VAPSVPGGAHRSVDRNEDECEYRYEGAAPVAGREPAAVGCSAKIFVAALQMSPASFAAEGCGQGGSILCNFPAAAATSCQRRGSGERGGAAAKSGERRAHECIPARRTTRGEVARTGDGRNKIRGSMSRRTPRSFRTEDVPALSKREPPRPAVMLEEGAPRASRKWPNRDSVGVEDLLDLRLDVFLALLAGDCDLLDDQGTRSLEHPAFAERQ